MDENEKEIAALLRKLESKKWRKGVPLPRLVWLGSFESWNARLITTVQTKKCKVGVVGGVGL